MTEEHGIRLS